MPDPKYLVIMDVEEIADLTPHQGELAQISAKGGVRRGGIYGKYSGSEVVELGVHWNRMAISPRLGLKRRMLRQEVFQFLATEEEKYIVVFRKNMFCPEKYEPVNCTLRNTNIRRRAFNIASPAGYGKKLRCKA